MASFYNTINNIMKLLSNCCQNAVKMLSNCSQNALKILLNYCVLHPLPIHLFLK